MFKFIGEKNETKPVINLTITKKSSVKKGDNSAGDIVHILHDIIAKG